MKGRTTLLLGLIVAVCSCGIAAQRTECKNATLADIVFLVDGSTSIGTSNFEEIKHFIQNITEALDIGPNKVQIGLAQYSDTTQQEFLLKAYTDRKSVLAAIGNIRYQEGGTKTGQAISFLKEKYFIEDAGSRISQQVPQIAVVITDGDSWDDVKVPAQTLREEGVRVFGIAVGLNKLEVLHSIANRPPEHFVFAIDNFKALRGLTDSLLQTVCTSMEDLREALAEKFADFFFLVDSGLNQRQFTKFRTELVEFINQQKIGASAHRVGLAQYAQDTNTAFLLNAFQTQQETLAAVRRFRLKPQPNQPHNLGAAIEHASSNFFSREAGGRAHLDYDQYLVIVTARGSDDSVHWSLRWSNSQGVTVGAMAPAAPKYVIDILSSADFAFVADTLDPLKYAISIEKQENVTGDCTGANMADIVFIVDESDSIGTTNFRLVRSFLRSMVAGLDVKQSRVRIGIVTYNDRPKARVYLDSFDDKAEILQFVKILPYRGGGRNTGAALNFTLREIFNNQRGHRKGVQQVAVVITDGESKDNVSNEALALRRAGVTMYAVGVQNANVDELREMASYPLNTHVFHSDNFTTLKLLKQSLQKTMCNNIIQESITDSTEKTDVKEACGQKEQADIFFLMDDSGSIENDDFDDMLKFINKLICNFRIGPQHVRIGLVKFASSPSLQFDLTDYSDTKSLENAVNRINHDGGGTETGRALSFMGPRFRRAADSHRQGVPRYLIVLTDGKSTDGVKVPADELRDQGVTILAIGVKDAIESELQEIAGSPQRTFFVTNFDALNSIATKIPIDICAADACSEVQSDVFFLADSSRTIHPKDYQKMKDFLKSIINESFIGQNEMHVGLMQYSTIPELIFPLNRFYSKDEMVLAIENMQHMVRYDTTETGKAITQVSEYFDAARGGRPGLRQKLIVITDGDSHDDVKPPAAALRAKEVVIYAIGVGQADTSELIEISGSVDRVITERNFDTLKNLDKSMALKLCDPKRECKKIERADIIFLVDGSGSISPTQFESMRKFMMSVVNQTAVGDDLTRFGFILFSDEPESKFKLNTYRSKRDVLTAIEDVMPPELNTYTSKALKYSLQFFSAEHGGRKANKVPQILMVITDGEAHDPQDLKNTSDALRDNGITVFSIGVKEAKRAELETMAGGDTSKVFFVDNFKALETLYKNISSELCGSTKSVCPKEQADLVFLLDQSGSISSTDYSTMINFTSEVVKSFNVSKENVHVGLAQFSTENKHEFYLNKYDSSSDVITHIKSLTHSGGGTLIGKALNYIKDYFEPSQGSRTGISKNLVLITDGDSQDNVKPAADLLKNLGIEVFAIGVGNVHDVELLQIAGVRERLFRVENFNGLDEIKSKFVDTICDSTPVIPDCSIDIAMGFDISRTRARSGPLISGQSKLQTFLPEIVRYVSSVDGLCCFGYRPIQTNIGFRVVSRDGRTLDDFNFEGYSEDVVNKVMTLNLAEPTYFNSALLRSFGQKFKTKSQARVKVLVIFSDGLDEDVMNLQMESEELRKSGINALLTVALEGVRNPAQLQKLEFGRGFDYDLPLSIGMPSVGSNILKLVDKAGNRVCCGVMCKCEGHEGPPGSYGRRGPKGSVGQGSRPGFPGDEGDAGDRGPPGPDGAPGFRGCPGARGVKGNRGISGNTGDLGEDGLDAVDGEQGSAGSNGAQGQRGDSGDPGIPGIRGQKGQKGERGLRGDPGEPGLQNNIPGEKGDPGYRGLNGESGPDGLPGEPGDNGNKGQDGRRGPPGEKGRPGQGGGRGVPGSPGASGPQGRPGPNGERGPKGNPGFPGLQGEPGPAGDPGLPGSRGANGQKGQPGDLGVKGALGSPGHIGAPGQDGRDGYGPSGPKGVKGDPGFPGHPGSPGDYGQQGTKGYPGGKGNRGRGGISGEVGLPGTKGDPGLKGHRGRKGPPGDGEDVCKLIQIIRDNCGCSLGQPECPAYPTELVFALDMSEDVTPAAFERQRSALLSLLEDLAISKSNCPTGARVAVVGYNTYTRYLICFQDHRRKEQLIEAVKNIALERTSNRRQLGAAMRFVGQNVFKRVRSGLRMRKVAVFFSNGPSQDSPSIVTSVMEFRALNIVPAVVSLRSAPAVSRALQVDDSGNSIFTVLGADMAASLSRVKNCAICYDPCRRLEECTFIQDAPQPQEVNMDLVMVVDSSREMQADEYAGAQELLGSVVEQLAVSQQPRRAGNQARVAVVQQSATRTISAEFGLQTYQSGNAMRRHLIQTMRQQSGSSALGQTLEFALSQVLLKASQPRRRRAILTVVGTKTAYEDRAKLRFISQKAKCEGVALFVVTVGERYSREEVEELASAPVQQHLIHVSRLKADEQGYTQRFFRVFLSALSKGMNSYPPPALKRTCDQLTEQGGGQTFVYGQGPAVVVEEEFTEEEEEQFEEQTGGQTQTGQLDVIETLTRGDGQRFVSAANINAQCQLEADSGIQCDEYVQAWFFDKAIGACSPFWYGGCGGNANRFNTESECYRTCGAHSQNILPKPELASFITKDSCFLGQDPGSCQNYTMMWFFDTEQSECSRFWYGGCGGNENRFNTQEECENLCLTKSR